MSTEVKRELRPDAFFISRGLAYMEASLLRAPQVGRLRMNYSYGLNVLIVCNCNCNFLTKLAPFKEQLQ